MSRSTVLREAMQLGIDCKAGLHVARLGSPCLGCGDPGPALAKPGPRLQVQPITRKGKKMGET